jgi:hypothetical protein
MIPQQAPSLQEKITRLAEDLSSALAEYDEGQWIIEARAAHAGRPIFALQPAEISPRLQVEMLSKKLGTALEQLRPGTWRSELDLEDGWLCISRDEDDSL